MALTPGQGSRKTDSSPVRINITGLLSERQLREPPSAGVWATQPSKTELTMGIVVIYACRPNVGQKNQVHGLLKKHVPALRSEGLITDRPTLLLWGEKDQVFVESFEWMSVEHARRAESSSAIQGIWKALAEHGEFVPLAKLTETAQAFSHFQSL